MKKLIFLAPLWLAGSLAYGQSFLVTPSGSSVLRLTITDAKPKSGVCPYYAKTIQYLPALQLLNVELYQETCQNDAYGLSTGEIYWVAPKSLRNKKSELHILVNQAMTSTLKFDEQRQGFVVQGDE